MGKRLATAGPKLTHLEYPVALIIVYFEQRAVVPQSRGNMSIDDDGRHGICSMFTMNTMCSFIANDHQPLAKVLHSISYLAGQTTLVTTTMQACTLLSKF